MFDRRNFSLKPDEAHRRSVSSRLAELHANIDAGSLREFDSNRKDLRTVPIKRYKTRLNNLTQEDSMNGSLRTDLLSRQGTNER